MSEGLGQFPASPGEIGRWASAHHVTRGEAQVRFAQYAILYAIGGSNVLRSVLVFKGGNALDFIWQPNRSTSDLDFSVDMAMPQALFVSGTPREPALRQALQQALLLPRTQFGTLFQVQGIRQDPPGEGKTFITYRASVGYALPDDRRNAQRMQAGLPSRSSVALDISLNEPICGVDPILIGGTHYLRTCTIEDIVAEKLRAFLQQEPRNRSRPQDVLDIAVILSEGKPLDRTRLAEFLLVKAQARGIVVSRAGFRQPELALRASQDYDALARTTRYRFIPFAEAIALLYHLAAELPIPEDA